MKIVRELDEHCWREFVLNHPQGQIFHTPEMFEVFDRTKGHRPTLWAVVDGSGQVLALLPPVQITLLQKWLRPLASLTTRSVSYGSVLCAPNGRGQKALAMLLQSYTKQVEGRPLFTELRNLSDTRRIQSNLCEHGFEYEEHLNFLIDIKKPPQAILQNIGQRTRKNIQRGLRQGLVKIVEAERPEQVTACYELLQQTYKAAHVPLSDRSLFEAAFHVLHPKGMIRFTLAYVDQTPVATSIDLLYKDVIYGWYGGVDRDYARYMPNELLTWHILEWGAEHGYAVYDFGGAGKPDEDYGPRAFKAKFGGTLVNYGRNIFVHLPLTLKLSQASFKLVRMFL
jgi:lipid II:glycine glycyltransferase (peptidoglycan interpeptide bridge formation enzyme)